MTTLHILKPTSSAADLFSGVFGQIAQSPKEGRVFLKVDPALGRCSNMMQTKFVNEGMEVRAEDVISISADDSIISAIKATLMRGLQRKWGQMYDAQLSRFDQHRSYDDGAGREHAATVVAIPGMGSVPPSVLVQALRAEQEVADLAINAAIQNLGEVAPYLVNVALKSAAVQPGFESSPTKLGTYIQDVEATDPKPVAIANWGDFTHPEYSPTANEPLQGDAQAATYGHYDLTAAIPLYLPSRQSPGQVGSLMRSLFSFSSRPQQAPRPAEPSNMTSIANEVMAVILSNPELKSMIVSRTAAMVPDYRVMTLSQHQSNEVFEDEDDEDEDFNESDERRERP